MGWWRRRRRRGAAKFTESVELAGKAIRPTLFKKNDNIANLFLRRCIDLFVISVARSIQSLQMSARGELKLGFAAAQRATVDELTACG